MTNKNDKNPIVSFVMGQGLNEKGTPKSLLDKHNALMKDSASKM